MTRLERNVNIAAVVLPFLGVIGVAPSADLLRSTAQREAELATELDTVFRFHSGSPL